VKLDRRPSGLRLTCKQWRVKAGRVLLLCRTARPIRHWFYAIPARQCSRSSGHPMNRNASWNILRRIPKRRWRYVPGIAGHIAPAGGQHGLREVIASAYSDMSGDHSIDLQRPVKLAAHPGPGGFLAPGGRFFETPAWANKALAARHAPGPLTAGPRIDLCVIPTLRHHRQPQGLRGTRTHRSLATTVYCSVWLQCATTNRPCNWCRCRCSTSLAEGVP